MTTIGLRPIARTVESAPVAPLDCCPIMDLKFVAPRVSNGAFGNIAIGSESIHRINNIQEFYADLGYKADGAGGLLPEEFIWNRYIRDGASKSVRCMQSLIANYLYTHSASFKRLYGCAYEKMIGKCQSKDIDDSDDHCHGCPMHPPLRH